jgi:hypothetical protein
MAYSWCSPVLWAASFYLIAPAAGCTGWASSGKHSGRSCCIWSHMSENKHSESSSCDSHGNSFLTFAVHPLLR